MEQRRCKATAAGITFEIKIGFSKQEVVNFDIFRKYINVGTFLFLSFNSSYVYY